MDATQLSETLDYAIENDLPVMIHGDTGIGKTDIVKSAFRKLERDLCVIMPSTYESIDFRGIPKLKGDIVDWSAPDFIGALRAMRPGSGLFIDEANTNKNIETVMMQLILTRQVGPHKLPEGTRLVLAGNRMSDRAAAQKMNKALEDRMFHVDFEASLDPWLKWASAANIHPMVIAFLQFRGRDTKDRPGLFIWRDAKSQDQRSRPGPRAWADVSKVCDAPDAIRFKLIAGRVGEVAAAEFEAFRGVFKGLPPIPYIVANPDTAKIPSETSLQYAVSVALGHAANAANLDSLVRYMARVGKEWQAVMMLDAVRRKPALCETPAYIRWSAANADIAI